jgi:hypothetical protein
MNGSSFPGLSMAHLTGPYGEGKDEWEAGGSGSVGRERKLVRSVGRAPIPM